MSIQLKQRITGIIVGVIFIVIAVLFLFSGSKNRQQPAAQPTAQTTELSLPQYQESNVPGQTVAPTAAQPSTPLVTTPTTNTISSTTPPNAAKATEQAATVKINSTTSKVAPQQAAATHAPPKPSNATTATKTIKTAAPTSKSTVDSIDKKNVATTEVAQKKKDNSKWMISAGLYQEKVKAENFLRKLKADKYQASIQKGKVKDKIYYRVVIGPATGKDKVEKLAQKIEKVFKIKTTLISVAKTKTAVTAKKSQKSSSNKTVY